MTNQLKPSSKPRPKKPETSQTDLKKADEQVLRYRSQPDMKSRRFINPSSR